MALPIPTTRHHPHGWSVAGQRAHAHASLRVLALLAGYQLGTEHGAEHTVVTRVAHAEADRDRALEVAGRIRDLTAGLLASGTFCNADTAPIPRPRVAT